MRIDVGTAAAYAYTGGRAFDPGLPVAVFVHGAQHDHSVWSLQSRYLAHHGWSVLAFDLPGHGRSAGAPLPSIEAMATWLLAALDTAGVERAALVGHSMGALVALEAAARATPRASCVAMIGIAFPMKVSEALLAAARDDEPRAFDMINAWSHAGLGARPGCPAPGLSIFVQNRRLMERQRPGVLLADFTACNAYGAGFERADALACPALFVHGALDAMTPPRQARELVARVSAALARNGLPAPQVIEVAAAGHAVMAQRAEAVLCALKGFLRAPAGTTLPAS